MGYLKAPESERTAQYYYNRQNWARHQPAAHPWPRFWIEPFSGVGVTPNVWTRTVLPTTKQLPTFAEVSEGGVHKAHGIDERLGTCTHTVTFATASNAHIAIAYCIFGKASSLSGYA